MDVVQERLYQLPLCSKTITYKVQFKVTQSPHEPALEMHPGREPSKSSAFLKRPNTSPPPQSRYNKYDYFFLNDIGALRKG